MVFRKALVFVFLVFSLSGCFSFDPPEITDFIDLRPGAKFSTFSKIPLDVEYVEFTKANKKSDNLLNVERLSKVSIAKTVENWSKRRLHPLGDKNKLIVRLADAALIEKPVGHEKAHLNIRGNQLRYEVVIEVQLEFQDDNGYFMNVVESRVQKFIELPEAVSTTRRSHHWTNLIQSAMRELNVDLEKKLYTIEPSVVLGSGNYRGQR